MNRILRGKLGEDIAADYLKKKGYKIRERNFRTVYGEVDIIAEHGAQLVFVEVKYRSSLIFGQPYEAVNSRKLHKLVLLATHYCQQFHKNASASIEIVSITKTTQGHDIKHIKDVLM